MQSIFLCISIGTALFLISSSVQSEPYDRSVLDLITAFVLTAATLCAVQKWFPSFLDAKVHDSRNTHDTIPLNNTQHESSLASHEKRPTFPDTSTRSPWIPSSTILAAIILLTTRIELFRRTSRAAQCTSQSWESLLPLAMAVNECRYQQALPLDLGAGSESRWYIKIFWRLRSSVLQLPWRYVPSGLAMTYGCYSISGLWRAQTSTFICPIVSGEASSVPRLQKCAVVLDGLLLVIAQELLRPKLISNRKSSSPLLSCASILLGASTIWTVCVGITYIFKKEDMQWLTMNDNPSSLTTIWYAIVQGMVLSLFILSSMRYVSHNSLYQFSMILAFSVTIFVGTRNLWSSVHGFPPNLSNASLWPFLSAYFGFWSSLFIARTIGQSQWPRSSAWYLISLLAMLALILPRSWRNDEISVHPIESLMFEAKSQHERYISYASTSTDLRSAIDVYQERYHDKPPPGFDTWYQYATNRSVLVIDDYDQIYRDLLPLRTLSPKQLRQQTWEISSNPWNEISAIIIRNGRAEVAENVIPTHRWMLEGISSMINSFAEHLPDMDLAFNLNDESRVALPHTEISSHREHASETLLTGKSTWSMDRASGWIPASTQAYSGTVFENLSFQKNFRRFGSVGCPSNSLAIRQPYRSSQSHLCLQCLEPHSLGQFISNWTLSANVCHQPDMSHLHGFYLSPAAHKPTHFLVPVFSQSKASGYNDILYPSSWNYMDKVVYRPTNASGAPGTEEYSPGYPDPPFAGKDNLLYWRGATSEGVSASSHAWRGMVRQRLVHLANNASSDSDNDRTTVLLPSKNRKEAFSYYSLTGSGLKSLRLQQTTDIKLVDHIARCGGPDCADQAGEFGLVKPVDFQSHWNYKFLFDLDGAGFSGRFLPFLQSHSLPFKTALFREWYDSRITAWRHFVPIDMRLHGVWSTLAYFAGVDGIWPGSKGQRYTWEPHTAQGEIIAEEGRKWADTVLRKEDMEVYFFRLLLEWGRLTDDRRDELGFSLD